MKKIVISVIVLILLLVIQQNFILFKKSINNTEYGDYYTDGFFVYYQSGYLIDFSGYPFNIRHFPMAKRLSGVYFKSIYRVKDEFGNDDLEYIKNNRYVYFRDIKIKNADPNSFQILNDRYMKDKNNVFYNETKKITTVKNADPESFLVVDSDNGKDKNHFYWYGEMRKGKEPILSQDYGEVSPYNKDEKFVYYGNQEILGADSETFIVLSQNYAKDKNNVYCYDYHGSGEKIKKLEGADVNSFTIYHSDGTEYGKDKGSSYLFCKIE